MKDEINENIDSEVDGDKFYEIDKLILDEKEWRKSVFGIKPEYIYDIKRQNSMTCIHENEVNKITKWNLLHDVLNPYKHTKNKNSHYSPIIHVCMNTGKGRDKFKTFWILLDSECGYTIVIVRLIRKLTPKEDAVIKWHTQGGSITTNLNIKIYFTSPELSMMEIVTWIFSCRRLR